MGLSISKNIARALNGDIIVESLLGIGSKFTVILPYKTFKGNRKRLLASNEPSSHNPQQEGLSNSNYVFSSLPE